MCDKSRNTWLCVHWQWNTLEWCQLNALQASPVVHLVTPLSCVSLSMNTQPSVPAIKTSRHQCPFRWGSTLTNGQTYEKLVHVMTPSQYFAFWMFMGFCKHTLLAMMSGLMLSGPMQLVAILRLYFKWRSDRCPTLFSSCYHVREAGYELRQNDRFMCLWQEPISVRNSCKFKNARLWNNTFNLANHHLYKKETLSRNTL